MDQVRIGVLGAARIVPAALLSPARLVPGVSVVAIAARDPARARAFATRNGIPRAHESYAELLADPEIDAVYNPLPNSLHCSWTIKALEAGKHVLCEKPFAANAGEAQRMARAAKASRRPGGDPCVLMEAFHYRYHPLARRMKEVVTSGMLGTIRHIETWACIPLPFPRDIRYRYELAGGATMDMGVYAIHLLRVLGGEEPEVTRATARLASPQIDRWMTADFRFADGRTGRMTCALFSTTPLRLAAHVVGDLGEMTVLNPFAPQRGFHRLTIRTAQGTRREQLSRLPSYVYQLRAFAEAVTHGAPILTPPEDSLATMRLIDAVYEKAGLSPRGLPMP